MPQFNARERGSIGRSDLNKLMLYHDRQFVELAYRLILGRQADEDGLDHHLQCIRSGESRREIAWRLGNSAEAKTQGVDPNLFRSYRIWRRIERIPVLGAVFLLLVCLARIRHIVREFRRIQNAVFGGLPASSMQAPK